MKTDKEIIQHLETVNDQLSTIGAETAAVSQAFVDKIAEAERIVSEFKSSGVGDLPTVHAAQGELDSIDRLLFDPKYRPLGQMAAQERQQFIINHAATQAQAAQEKFVRENAAELVAALEALIASRCQTRDQWRNDLVDGMQKLEKRVWLETLSEETARELRVRANEFHTELAARDRMWFEANRHVRQFRAHPSVTNFNDALGFSIQINYV